MDDKLPGSKPKYPSSSCSQPNKHQKDAEKRGRVAQIKFDYVRVSLINAGVEKTNSPETFSQEKEDGVRGGG